MFVGTKNFTPAEVACKCGCGMLPVEDFMAKVQKLRDFVGFTLPVSSAARCPEYNSKVSTTGRTGPHTTGRAIDFGVRGNLAHAVIAAAVRLGFTGIGVQQKGEGRFVHVDDLSAAPGQPRPTVWSY